MNWYFGVVFNCFIKNNLVNIWLIGYCLYVFCQGNWYNFLIFKLGFGGRQWVMDFNIMVVVWFGGCFYWFINKLYVGIDWYFFEQEFDVFVMQMYIIMIYMQVDIEVGVGVMDSIQVIDIECIQFYWVIWICWNDSWKWFVCSVVFCVYFGGWCSGWVCFFMFNFGGLVDRCIFV